MRIGIFGGGFNPPHIAHVLVAVYAKQMARLDHLLVLPCWDHAYEKRETLVPFRDRLIMCQLAFNGISGISVNDYEAAARSRYTIELVEYLYRFYGLPDGDTQLVLIVGSDNAKSMERWHRWDELKEMVELFPVTFTVTDMRSTQIREAVAKGDEGHLRKVLPPTVLNYIKQKGLYCTACQEPSAPPAP